MLRSRCPDGRRVLRDVPWNMQRDRPGRPVQRMQQADILDLFLKAPGLAAARKATKPRPARPQGPTGNGYLEIRELANHRFRVRYQRREKIEAAPVLFYQRLVMRGDLIWFQFHTGSIRRDRKLV